MNKHIPFDGDAIANAMSMTFMPHAEAFSDAANQGAEVMEEVVRGWRTIGEKGMANAVTNANAVVDVVKALASVKTMPDALKLQSEFVQKQCSASIEQTQEYFALSTKVAQDAFQKLCTAAWKTAPNGHS